MAASSLRISAAALRCAQSRAAEALKALLGFTALDGLPMGTRPGQLDPGVVLYLIMEKGISPGALQDMLYRECGLKGLSGISNDMRELEASADPKAVFALDYFRLSRRPQRGDAGGGHGRAGRLRLYSGHRRKFPDHARADRPEARLARHNARQPTPIAQAGLSFQRPKVASPSMSCRPTRNS